MAIYHFSVQVIGRASGRSAVAAAAYRAGERLHDERLDRDHDFRARAGVEHSEIMLPEGAPERLSDRATLWNEVEATEKRKDAQLAREVEFAIPREMSKAEGIELARDFVQAEFVDRGMIAELNVHRDMDASGMEKPHAHVMLTMREVGPDGFGQKVRAWNDHENVEQWRERWADHVNQRLAELDIDARIDHRSLAAQGIDLEPQSKIGGPAKAPCWAWRAMCGKALVSMCAARRWLASPPKGWKMVPALRPAPSPAWSMAGPTGATC